MLQFTNGFSCAVDQEKGDLIINFIQQVPKWETEEGETEVKMEEVVSLVMGKVMAQRLAESLSEICKEDEDE